MAYRADNENGKEDGKNSSIDMNMNMDMDIGMKKNDPTRRRRKSGYGLF